MATIAEQLTQLNDAKLNIKAAIEAKGVSDVGLDITVYNKKIEEIPQTNSKTALRDGWRFMESTNLNVEAFDWSGRTELGSVFRGNHWDDYCIPDLSNVFSDRITDCNALFWFATLKAVESLDLYEIGFGKLVNCHSFSNAFSQFSAGPKEYVASGDIFKASEDGSEMGFQNMFRSSKVVTGSLDIFYCFTHPDETGVRNYMLDRMFSDNGLMTTFNATQVNFKNTRFTYWDSEEMPGWNVFYKCPNLVNLNLNSGFFNQVADQDRYRSFAKTAYVPTEDLATWIEGSDDLGGRKGYLGLNSTQVSKLDELGLTERITAKGWKIVEV